MRTKSSGTLNQTKYDLCIYCTIYERISKIVTELIMSMNKSRNENEKCIKISDLLSNVNRNKNKTTLCILYIILL